jgi:adenosylcobinamide kinase/adenosylcobinamide-phosphate guanylyltransferase
MSRPTISLIGGGTRSGKSTFAVSLGLRLGSRRAFIATATTSDDEMRVRIDRHRQDRGEAFVTIEEPVALAEALRSLTACDVVVVDCVTHWLSNLLVRGASVDTILADVDGVVAVLEERRFHAVLVTNEVGMSVHPHTPLGRAFVEVSGCANQRLARVADQAYLAVMGTVLQIRPGLATPLTESVSVP